MPTKSTIIKHFAHVTLVTTKYFQSSYYAAGKFQWTEILGFDLSLEINLKIWFNV